MRRGRDTRTHVPSPSPPPLSLVRTQQEGHLEARKGSHRHFDLGLPASRTVRNTSVLFQPPVWGVPPRPRKRTQSGRLRDQTTRVNTEALQKEGERSARTPPELAARTSPPVVSARPDPPSPLTQLSPLPDSRTILTRRALKALSHLRSSLHFSATAPALPQGKPSSLVQGHVLSVPAAPPPRFLCLSLPSPLPSALAPINHPKAQSGEAGVGGESEDPASQRVPAEAATTGQGGSRKIYWPLNSAGGRGVRRQRV